MDYKVWETCFLLPFGLTRGECASWVQAWGSILAIVGTAGAAIYQARRQYQSTMAGLRLQQKQAHLQVAETLEQLATNTLKLQQHIAEKLTTREAVEVAADDGLPFDLPELRSLERSLESVALHELPATLVSPSMMLSWSVRQFRAKVEMALQFHRTMDAAAFDDFFQTTAQMTSSLEQTVNDFSERLAALRKQE